MMMTRADCSTGGLQGDTQTTSNRTDDGSYNEMADE